MGTLEDKMDKIFITGTGRCGTTFLIKLFSFLDFDTGYNNDNYRQFISENCNSGMERNYKAPYAVLKNPEFMAQIHQIVMDTSVCIKWVIIPIRDFNASANSRVKHQQGNGGLWRATDRISQIMYYNDLMSNYIYNMVVHDIPTIFIDFERMVRDKQYLYEKLMPVFEEKKVSFDVFAVAYDRATDTSKPSS